MIGNKKPPNGRLSEFSNGSQRVDSFKFQDQITSQVNIIHGVCYFNCTVKVNIGRVHIKIGKEMILVIKYINKSHKTLEENINM